MKVLSKMTAMALVLSLGVSATALGKENDKPARTLKTAEMMKAAVYDQIDDLKMVDFNLSDETVEITFTVDAEGKIVVNQVNCDNCLINAYVTHKLANKVFPVTEELQGTTHQMTVRYVVI